MRLNELQPAMKPLLVSPKFHGNLKLGDKVVGGYDRKAKISTTTAVYLLRFNVSLQIAVFAIAINLCLAIFTFYYGLNALYCAFGIDCVIGVITSSILVWRFASSKQEKLLEQVHLIRSYQNGLTTEVYTKSKSAQYDLFDSTIETDDPQDHVRELWSTFWLGQVMIVSGAGIIIRTIVELITHAIELANHKTDEDLQKFVDFETLFTAPKTDVSVCVDYNFKFILTTLVFL